MKTFHSWLALMLVFLVSACGGGGGDPGAVGGTPVTPVTPAMTTVSVALLNAAGQPANVLTSSSPLTVQATVKDGAGKLLPNVVVTFAGDATLIALSSSTGTSLTNGAGVATLTLRPFSNTVSGAGSISASVTESGTTVQGSANFQVESTAVVNPGTPAAPTIAVSLLNPAGQPSTSVSSAVPLTVQALVKDAAGNPVNNALVTFAGDNTLVAFSPSSGTTLSNAAGVASVTMRPLNLGVSGAGTVTASATVDTATIQGRSNFAVGATALALGNVTLTPGSIAAYGSSVVSVDVLAGGTKYADQQLNVNFSSLCVASGKATFAATVPTNNGTAQAVYRDQGCANNDVITASVDGVARTSSATLIIAAPAAASIQFSSAVPTDKSIVIKGQGGIARTETATLKFKVFDIFNNALPRQLVRFVSSTNAVTVNKTSDSTDANGEVITTVNSGTAPTTFRIQAILLNADGSDSAISTQSDSIVVTTGVAVQRAFSLSVGKPNVEGWTYDSGTTTPATNVNVLLADLAGNPVPDGTPVVFQTNMGSVGSASKGACNTVNGGCSVDFRTQAPRTATPGSPATPCNNATSGTRDSTRVGLATVCASTTDGTNTLFSKITIFFSGSTASNVYWIDNPAGTAEQSKRLTGAEVDLGTVGATDSKSFSLLVSDVNFNPMPSGTKVEVLNITNASVGGVAPATVQNVFAHSSSGDDSSGNNVDGNQGTRHLITIASSLPKPCTEGIVSKFSVAVTTPLGNSTQYPFKLAFSCP